ncbi:MAG: ATP-grasp domain-containing protein [Chloroflexi bacterium]|nr:ATP-grasp domain-containing protein [Chloroflexota bacterium]
MANPAKVLVTDAQMRNSLAVIRSLGGRGLEVTGAETTRFATALFSKYCRHKLIYPGPDNYPDRFVDCILNEVRSGGYRAIFPVTDSSVLAIAKHKKEFSKYTLVPLPDTEVLMQAMDKAETIRIAQKNGLACPETHFVNTPDELDAIKDRLTFPAVIKPRRSSGSRGLALCRSKEELSQKYQDVAASYGPCLVQEYIPHGGDELGVYLLLNHNSELRAVSVQRRLRSYPVSGGPSTLRETVSRPDLVEIAMRLLKAMAWWGIAMVEFKVDPRDNKPKLMEVNPRWWGSLQLSVLSGVDFPYLLYQLITEGDIEPVLDYRVGVRCRWLLPGDILWFLSAPHKLSNLPKFLKFERNDDIISLKDPGPTLGFGLASLRFAFDRDMWKFVVRESI